jgi:hypothetical protein
LIGQNHRKQKFVPRLRKLLDDHHSKTGCRKWQDDMTIDSEQTRAVDTGRFNDFGPNPSIVITEQKGWFIFSESWCLKPGKRIQYSLYIIGINLDVNDIP